MYIKLKEAHYIVPSAYSNTDCIFFLIYDTFRVKLIFQLQDVTLISESIWIILNY